MNDAHHGLQARDPDPEIDRELQAHALDATQLADAARQYTARLIYGVRPEDADHLHALAARAGQAAGTARREAARPNPPHREEPR
ncbi:hypothetical protein ACPC54_37365 [Kitasatospora sp. NPDC094028]